MIVAFPTAKLVIQSVIEPRHVGADVGLTPTITMLSLAFSAWVLGPLCAVLGVPLSQLLRALGTEADPAALGPSPIVSGRPFDEPPAA